MDHQQPNVVVIAGPNGSGKSTAAPRLLRDELCVETFVNADVIAQGLGGYNPDIQAMRAGRIMLDQLNHLEKQQTSFAFETTLATRSFAPRLRRLASKGYRIHIVFLWIPTPAFAIHRVANRVRLGGHHVPDDWVKRRYYAGLKNFFNLYQPLADRWQLYDNSQPNLRIKTATGGKTIDQTLYAPLQWDTIQQQVSS